MEKYLYKKKMGVFTENVDLSCHHVDLKRTDINKFNKCSNIDYYLQ